MKKINLFITFSIMMFLSIVKVDAFSINASSSVYVNNTVAVKVEANGLTGRFDISSSNQAVLAGNDSKWIENGSVTLYFKATSVGKATITVNAVDVSDSQGNEFTGSRSITINVIKKASKPSVDVNKVYSKNNYLKSLEVEGYEISPKFDKSTLEYNVELEPGTEEMEINVEKEDSKASVKGDGKVKVTEGINTVKVKVTAENGNEKTYVLNVKVDEKDPINIKIGKNKYTVVKRKELIEKKDGYDETTVKIKKFDIPALYNAVTKIYLVGVKDSEGKITLVSYDSKTGVYDYYNEFKFDLMNLYIHKKDNSKYEKEKIKINGEEIEAYKLESVDDYYLLYATNTITGYEGYYLYDVKENSVQRYDTKMLDTVTFTKDKYFSIVLVLSCVCFLTMLFLLIEVNKKVED